MNYSIRTLVKIVGGACLILVGGAVAFLPMISPSIRYRLPVAVGVPVVIGLIMVCFGIYLVFSNIESLHS